MSNMKHKKSVGSVRVVFVFLLVSFLVCVVEMLFWQRYAPLGSDTYQMMPDQMEELDRDTSPKEDMTDPVVVAKQYLDAYVRGDWTAAKSLSGRDFDETIAENYAYVAYSITGTKQDANSQYYHVFVQFTDKDGKVYTKAPYGDVPLEVMLFRNNDGTWKAMTWYFYQ